METPISINLIQYIPTRHPFVEEKDLRRTEQIVEALEAREIWFKLYSSGDDGLEIAFVVDQRMYCVVASWGMGWDHVSVHMEILTDTGSFRRLPIWDDMCLLKDLFFHPNEWAIQYHPPASKNISVHNDVLHLWRPQRQKVPKPPRNYV